MCEELMGWLEAETDPETWLCACLPVTRHLINFITVERFVQERALGRDAYCYWRIEELGRNAPNSFGPLIRHLEGLEESGSIRPWDYHIFKAPTERTYLKIAECHRRIAESHAKLSERLRAAQNEAQL